MAVWQQSFVLTHACKSAELLHAIIRLELFGIWPVLTALVAIDINLFDQFFIGSFQDCFRFIITEFDWAIISSL